MACAGCGRRRVVVGASNTMQRGPVGTAGGRNKTFGYREVTQPSRGGTKTIQTSAVNPNNMGQRPCCVGGPEPPPCERPAVCPCGVELPGAAVLSESFRDPQLPGWSRNLIGGGTVAPGLPNTYVLSAGPPTPSVAQIGNASVLVNPLRDDYCICARFGATVAVGDIPNAGAGVRGAATAPGALGGPGIAIVHVNGGGLGTFDLFVWDAFGNLANVGLLLGDNSVHDWEFCVVGDIVTISQDGIPVPFGLTRTDLAAMGLPDVNVPGSLFADSSGAPAAAAVLTSESYCLKRRKRL